MLCCFFRLNNIQVQNEFLKQIPRMAEITLPTNYLDWKSKQMTSALNAKGVTNTPMPGRRDLSSATEEPRYMLIRSEDSSPRHMGITLHSLSSYLFVLFMFSFCWFL